MKTYEGEFKGADGTRLYCKNVYAEGDRAEKNAVLVHGFGEHCGRYGNLIAPLVEKGYGVHLMDMRGHGKSKGKRGHVLKYTEYTDDLELFFKKLEAERGVKKAQLVGHSQGGLIVLRYALDNPGKLITVSASGSLLRLRVKVPKLKEVPGKIMSKYIPGFSMSNGLSAADLSHDQAVVKAYEDDPLVHDRASARWFTEMIWASADALGRAKTLKIPCLVMHGSADALTDPSGSMDFFNSVQVKDKELKIYDGMFHEIFNEIGKEKPISDLMSWIKRHE